MTRGSVPEKEDVDSDNAAISFTARLNAHYRAIESTLNTPLFVDPYAERLAGDMTEYFENHRRFTDMGGSQIARSFYIDSELLIPWCKEHEQSQIVLLGAGLDTHAYRFTPLQNDSHSVFELDLPMIIKYKEEILKDEKPLCTLIRLSSDLSKPEWQSILKESDYSTEIPTFWILEGLVYYIEQEQVHNLLATISTMSTKDSQLFADVCVPALADLQWGPFSYHFKWGISMRDIPQFFKTAGWRVTTSYLDEHAHGKDVGQKGLILVHGFRDRSGISSIPIQSKSEASMLHAHEVRNFSKSVVTKLLSEIMHIIEVYKRGPQQGLMAYVKFIRRNESAFQTIAKGQTNPVLLGQISPRLLGDPLSIERDTYNRTNTEIESYLVGNLRAILQLVYCGMKGLQAEQFKGSSMDVESKSASTISGFESLLPLIELLKQESSG